ncbi:MAG: hypothetical protein AAED33_03835 [Paracoccaceae bacterium]
MTRGVLYYAHTTKTALAQHWMASISAHSFFFAQILEFLLLASITMAAILEIGWSRALSLLQIIFAATLILGLPFRSA